MVTLEHLLLGGVLPAAVVAVILAVVWRVWRRDDAGGAACAGSIAVAAAFVIAFVAVRPGLPEYPPRVVADKLPYLAVTLGLLAAVARGTRVHRRILLGIAFGVCAAIAWWLLRPLVPHAMSLGELAGWIAVTAVIGGLWIWSAERVADRTAGWTAGLWIALLGAGLSAAIALGGSQKTGQYAGGIAAAGAAFALMGLVRCRITPARGAATTAAVLLLSTLLVAHFYAAQGFSTPVLSLLAVAPVLPAVATFRWTAAWRPWVRGAAAVALLLIPLGTAIAILAVSFARAQHDAAPYAY